MPRVVTWSPGLAALISTASSAGGLAGWEKPLFTTNMTTNAFNRQEPRREGLVGIDLLPLLKDSWADIRLILLYAPSGYFVTTSSWPEQFGIEPPYVFRTSVTAPLAIKLSSQFPGQAFS